jgi:hypothetical protein
MVETSEQINAVLWLIVAIIALVPLIVFLKSYLRVRTRKLLMTTTAFILFFSMAMILAMRLVVPSSDTAQWYMDDEFWWSIAAVMDIAIICLIAFSLTLRDEPLP